MRAKIILLVAVVAVLVIVMQNPPPYPPSFIKGGGWGEDFQKQNNVLLRLGGGVFQLRVADSEFTRTRGLGGTAVLAPNAGMFFIFPEDGVQAIWMKDMLIPIDIVWLSADLSVIDIRANASPDSFPEIFTPRAPARFVVELSAGAAAAFHITAGSRAEIVSE